MKKTKYIMGDIVGLLVAFVFFIVPFIFMFFTSVKDRRSANLLTLSIPKEWLWGNYLEVIQANDYLLVKAFKNSIILTAGSVFVLVLVSSMAGYVMQRRNDRTMHTANICILAGLMVPPAILPTIWVMQGLHLYKTLVGMIFIEAALQIPFSIMLYRGFAGTIPVELEEAGYIDGCTRGKMFRSIVFPLLKPVTSTVIILDAVAVFNDFTNPLYFLPGNENATVQLTLYNFTGKFSSSNQLLFADVILITIPMLLVFIIFNKKIVDGMVAGSVKG